MANAIEVVREALLEMNGTAAERALTEETELAELGIDSLKYVELLVLIEEKSGLVFNESDLGADAVRTIGDLNALIEKTKLEQAS